MSKSFRTFGYFAFWSALAACALVLNMLNIDWTKTAVPRGAVITLLLFIIHSSVLEFPVMTVTTLLAGGNRDNGNTNLPSDHLALVLNYNLLAISKEDIDECLQTMYEAYMGNLSWNISAVMVSATNCNELQKYELEVRDNYRALITDELFREGFLYIQGSGHPVHSVRLKHIWSHYRSMDARTFLDHHLKQICSHASRNFMVIHRVSRVLRKCGQYQDLMLLSAGDNKAYTYTDPTYYGRYARPYDQPLFRQSDDVDYIFNRNFDYTFVLDSDTRVKEGTALAILQIAAANPDKGIIQPAIKLHCLNTDTMFMHLEKLRQSIYEPMTNAVTSVLGQSSFFGKGLIKNSLYIEHVIGPRNNVLEKVPIDVLSHDTFEAALLKPLYAGSVSLLEAPTYNYVAWNMRERRWNRGEILLATYFWKHIVGWPMRWLQYYFQGEDFVSTRLRTELKVDFVSSYIAHSALRQIIMKPLLLAYIILHFNIHLHYRNVSLIVVMFLVLVFPKFATCNRTNYKYVVLETVASVLQFTPEALVGCVRIFRAMQAVICANVSWVPQRAVEEEFKTSNPFLSALKHLWGYSLGSLICSSLVGVLFAHALFILMMLVPVFALPLYTGFTSLSPNGTSTRQPSPVQDEESIIGGDFRFQNGKENVLFPGQKRLWKKCMRVIRVCLSFDPKDFVKKTL